MHACRALAAARGAGAGAGARAALLHGAAVRRCDPCLELELHFRLYHAEARTHSPASPIGVHHYGSILRVHSYCSYGEDSVRVAQDLANSLLGLALALDALHQALQDNIANSVLQGILFSQYRTVQDVIAMSPAT